MHPRPGDKVPTSKTLTTGHEPELNPKLSFMRMLLRRRGMPLIFILFFVLSGLISSAQISYNWNGIVSTVWTDPLNWTPSPTTGASYPGSAATDIISIPALITTFNRSPDLSSNSYSIGKLLTFGSDAAINGTGTLTLTAAGTLAASGSVNINCPLHIKANTTFNCSNTDIINLAGGVTSDAGFTITKTGTSGTLELGAATIHALTINSAGGNVLLSANTVLAGRLTLTNGILEMGLNITLTLNGGLTRLANASGFISGKPSSSLILSGATGAESLYFFTYKEQLKNLTLAHSTAGNTTTNLYTALTIFGGISFGSSKDLLNFRANHVTLRSNVSGTAYIGQNNNQLSGASNVTVERYIDGSLSSVFRRAWRLLTIPVTGVQTIRDSWTGDGVFGVNPNPDASEKNGNINPEVDVTPISTGTLITGHGFPSGADAIAQGFDWFPGLGATTTSSIRFYSPAFIWASATNTPDINLAPDKEGYMLYVRGDRFAASNSAVGYTTLMPTGTLKQGTITIPVADNFTVVGNPYAAPISLDAIYNNTGNSAVIKRNFWIFDATLGTAGAYRALSGDGDGVYTMTGRGGNPSDYLIINSSQAFFVEKNGTGGDIIIEENDKVTTTPPIMFRPTTPTGGVSKLDIKLYQAVGATVGLQADGVVGRYNDIYSVSPFETYDAAKMNNFNENLSLVRGGRYLSIESRPYPTQKDTLFLSFWGLKNRDYAFTITSSMFTGLNQTAKLVDNFTNTQTVLDLADGSVTYPFSVTSNVASSSLNRFMIVMSPSTVLPVTFTKVNAVSLGSKVQVSWATGSELGVKNYAVERSADGSSFTKIAEVAARNAANGAAYQWMDNQPLKANSFYRIRSNDADGKYAFSNIAIVQLNASKGIQVMPTVISNKRFTITLNDQPAGNYQLLITNAAGQQVYQKMIAYLGGNNTQAVELGNAPMPTGVYNLTVSGLNGSNQNFRLLINN
jgi:hypothetical protein